MRRWLEIPEASFGSRPIRLGSVGIIKKPERENKSYVALDRTALHVNIEIN